MLPRLLLDTKIAKNGPKQHKALYFCPKGKKNLGRSPPQELEVGPRSGPYLLVELITFYLYFYIFFKIIYVAGKILDFNLLWEINTFVHQRSQGIKLYGIYIFKY